MAACGYPDSSSQIVVYGRPTFLHYQTPIIAADGDTCWGIWDPQTRSIALDTKLKTWPDSGWLYYRHELVHAALDGRAEKLGITEAQEDSIAWVIARSGIVK